MPNSHTRPLCYVALVALVGLPLLALLAGSIGVIVWLRAGGGESQGALPSGAASELTPEERIAWTKLRREEKDRPIRVVGCLRPGS